MGCDCDVQDDHSVPLYNLSTTKLSIRSVTACRMRFLGLGLEGRVPDAKTVWLYREQLTQAGVIEALFETFDGYLKDQGYLAMGGQIIDASIVAVPKQRNSREENARIKAGETPAGWEDKPAKRRQKDVEARWTKKHGKSDYGYKNHAWRSAQAGAALSCKRRGGARQPSPRRYPGWGQHGFGCVGGQRLPLGGDRGVAEGEGLRSRIHRKGRRNKPLSEREKQGNKTRSSVRVRVEHVFGAQSNDMGGTLVRSVGLVRAKARFEEPRLQHAPPNWSVSRRPCDDTRRRRPPGDGLEAEITQLERGRPRKSRLRHGWSW